MCSTKCSYQCFSQQPTQPHGNPGIKVLIIVSRRFKEWANRVVPVWERRYVFSLTRETVILPPWKVSLLLGLDTGTQSLNFRCAPSVFQRWVVVPSWVRSVAPFQGEPTHLPSKCAFQNLISLRLFSLPGLPERQPPAAVFSQASGKSGRSAARECSSRFPRE